MQPSDLEDMGPIDQLVVEFPGSKMTGIIRILDLVFVKKELDGSVSGLAIADLDKDGELDLAVFEGASSGLLDQGTWTRPAACSSPAARPGCWSTRTAGRTLRQGLARRRPARRPRPHPHPGRARRPRRHRGVGRLAPAHCAEGSVMPGLLRGSHARPWSPGRPRPCPTGCRGGRPTSRRPRSSSRTDRHNRPISRHRPISSPSSSPPADDMDAKISQLRELGELKSQGVLTEAEFAAQKQRILGSEVSERGGPPAVEATSSNRLAILLAMAMFVLVVDTSLMNVSIVGGPGPRHDGQWRPVRDRARSAGVGRLHPDRQQGRRPHRA